MQCLLFCVQVQNVSKPNNNNWTPLMETVLNIISGKKKCAALLFAAGAGESLSVCTTLFSKENTPETAYKIASRWDPRIAPIFKVEEKKWHTYNALVPHIKELFKTSLYHRHYQKKEAETFQDALNNASLPCLPQELVELLCDYLRPHYEPAPFLAQDIADTLKQELDLPMLPIWVQKLIVKPE